MARKTPIPNPAQQDPDNLFRAQMKVANVLLGYWKQALGAVGLILLISLVVGLVQNHIRDTQRELSARIAKVDQALPEQSPLSRYGLAPRDDLQDQEHVEALQKAAEAYEAIATDGSGAGGAEAWIKAGDTWERLNQHDKAAEAFRAAHDMHEDGIIAYAAGNRLAHVLRRTGGEDAARQVLRDLSTRLDGFLAERALMDLIDLEIDNGNLDTARKLLAEFKARFSTSPRLEQLASLETRISESGS